MTRLPLKLIACLSLAVISAAGYTLADTCTNATLTGAYGFQETGKHTEATGFNEFRSVGTMVFDGRGNAKFSITLWFSDLTINILENEPMSYAVQRDCTFTFTYLLDSETFTGVIANGGQKLLYLETSGDPMRTGQAERQRAQY